MVTCAYLVLGVSRTDAEFEPSPGAAATAATIEGIGAIIPV
jgi:hypothetical protein